jgi:hypothetical protein
MGCIGIMAYALKYMVDGVLFRTHSLGFILKALGSGQVIRIEMLVFRV